MLEAKSNLPSDPVTDALETADGPGGRLVAAVLEKVRATQVLIGRCEPLEVTDVHQSRKNLKKVRAGLKLLADADGLDLGEANRLSRDVGRLLSELRDTDVCLMTLEDIDPGLTRFGGLAGKLQARRETLHRRKLPNADAHREILADLSAVESILGSIRHTHITSEDLGRALRKTRKRATKRFALLDAGTNPHAYHDFRKATKRELYQARYLAEDGHRDERVAELDRLGECLGNNQDLLVLGEVAEGLGELDPELKALIDDRRSVIRAECRRLAKALYGHER